jgi:hypothetical protein
MLATELTGVGEGITPEVVLDPMGRVDEATDREVPDGSEDEGGTSEVGSELATPVRILRVEVPVGVPPDSH